MCGTGALLLSKGLEQCSTILRLIPLVRTFRTSAPFLSMSCFLIAISGLNVLSEFGSISAACLPEQLFGLVVLLFLCLYSFVNVLLDGGLYTLQRQDTVETAPPPIERQKGYTVLSTKHQILYAHLLIKQNYFLKHCNVGTNCI